MFTLRTVTRTSTALTLVCIVVASWLTFVTPTASALEREGVTVTVDQVVTQEYGPVAGNNPAGSAHGPEECVVVTYCDAIPLEVIVPPGWPEDQTYFVQYVVEWDTERAPGDPVLEPEGYTTNDMDVYVYTNPPTAEEAKARGHTPNSNGDPYVSTAGSGTTPEKGFIFVPNGTYWIIINNFLGTNTGYTLTVSWLSETFGTPFEVLAPDFRPTTTTTTSTTTTAPPTTVAPPTTAAAAPTLEPVTVEPDADFDLSQFDGDFEDELAAPIPDIDLTASGTQAPSPSGLALVFWFLAVPFGVVALGGAFVLRNRATI